MGDMKQGSFGPLYTTPFHTGFALAFHGANPESIKQKGRILINEQLHQYAPPPS